MNFESEESLLNFTKNIIGKKFKNIDKTNLLNNNTQDKGILGKFVEYDFYGYYLNNKCEADFLL